MLVRGTELARRCATEVQWQRSARKARREAGDLLVESCLLLLLAEVLERAERLPLGQTLLQHGRAPLARWPQGALPASVPALEPPADAEQQAPRSLLPPLVLVLLPPPPLVLLLLGVVALLLEPPELALVSEPALEPASCRQRGRRQRAAEEGIHAPHLGAGWRNHCLIRPIRICRFVSGDCCACSTSPAQEKWTPRTAEVQT